MKLFQKKKDKIPDPICCNYNFSLNNTNKVIKLLNKAIVLRFCIGSELF